MDIDIENFSRWKKDPVTLALMKFLGEVREYLEAGMLNPGIVLEDGGLIQYSRAVGHRDGIDMVLEVEFNDLIEDREASNDNEEISTTFVE